MEYMQGNPYPPGPAWGALMQQIQHLHGRLEEQQQCMLRLFKQMDDLQCRVQAAESRPVYHIDSLQYHFDQLKVEKLEGTLNIGMTAPSGEQMKEIGQLVVPENAFPQNGPPPAAEEMDQATSGPNIFPAPGASANLGGVNPGPPFPELRQEINRFLDMNAPQRLTQLEAEHGLALDAYHRRLIIEDIRKQMGTRIHYYIQSGMKTADTASGDPAAGEARLKSDVLNKTTRDIETAMRGYLLGLQTGTVRQKEGENNR